MTELEERFMQYHREIDRAFLAAGATPFQITKSVWRLHAEMGTFLAIHAAQQARAADPLPGATDDQKSNSAGG